MIRGREKPIVVNVQVPPQENRAEYGAKVFHIGFGAVGAFGLLAACWSPFLEPVLTRELRIEADRLRIEADRIPTLTSQVRVLETRIEEHFQKEALVRETQDKADRLLAEIENQSVLSCGSPYPIGLRSVTVGDNLLAIKKAYREDELEEEFDGGAVKYVTVKRKSGLIDNAVYYFDESSEKISHIAFNLSLQDWDKREALETVLRHALGRPTAEPRPTAVRWKLPNGDGVFLYEPSGYQVVEAGSRPSTWGFE